MSTHSTNRRALRSLRWLPVLLVSLVPAFARGEASRVAVLEARQEADEKAEGLTEAIVAALKNHSGISVVSGGDVTAALAEQEKNDKDCRTKPACMATLTRALHADAVVDAVFARKGKGFAVEMALFTADATPPRRHSETMKFAKSAGMNAGLCVDDLVKSPIPAASAPLPEIEPPPPPPPEPVAPPPPPAPVATAAPIAPTPPASTPAPAGGARKLRLAVLDLVAREVPAETASSLTAVTATELERLGVFSIMSMAEIHAMLTQMKNRQILGCDGSDATCNAELGDALGADYLLSGSVGKVGNSFVASLAITDIAHQTVEGRASETQPDVSQLLTAIRRMARTVVAKVLTDHSGTLLLSVSEKGATVKVDGQIVGVTPLGRRPIAWGPHLLEVEKPGFITSSEDITVATRGLVDRSVTLIPSPDYIAQYESQASRMRVGAWVATVAGAAALGAAGYFGVTYASQVAEFNSRRNVFSETSSTALSQYNTLASLKQSASGTMTWAYVSGGVGVAAAAAATFFWIAGDDPNRYEKYREGGQPHASVTVSPAGPAVAVVGRF